MPGEVRLSSSSISCGSLASLALTTSASGALAPDLTRGILVEKVGDISVEYDPNSAQQVRYQAIDLLLKPLLKAGGGSSTVSLSR